MNKDFYVVWWMDHVNLCVGEISSDLKKAKRVKKFLNDESGFYYDYDKYDDFMKFLKKIRRCKEENWVDFSPSPKDIREATIDYNYSLIDTIGEENVNYIGFVPSIGVKANLITKEEANKIWQLYSK